MKLFVRGRNNEQYLRANVLLGCVLLIPYKHLSCGLELYCIYVAQQNKCCLSDHIFPLMLCRTEKNLPGNRIFFGQNVMEYFLLKTSDNGRMRTIINTVYNTIRALRNTVILINQSMKVFFRIFHSSCVTVEVYAIMSLQENNHTVRCTSYTILGLGFIISHDIV